MEKCEALSTKPEECRYSFFQHTACEFFPCHETAHPEDFNCLFCYCPLYALGDRCGGNFRYICPHFSRLQGKYHSYIPPVYPDISPSFYVQWISPP